MKTYYPIQKLVNKLSITICSVIHSISSVLNGIVVLKPFSFNTQPNKTIYSPKTKWLLQKFLFWEPLLETPRAVNMVFLPRKKKKNHPLVFSRKMKHLWCLAIQVLQSLWREKYPETLECFTMQVVPCWHQRLGQQLWKNLYWCWDCSTSSQPKTWIATSLRDL